VGAFDGAERLIERADRALFQAKAAGKGRVVAAS
jgi:PleD family two-component response regulator